MTRTRTSVLVGTMLLAGLLALVLVLLTGRSPGTPKPVKLGNPQATETDTAGLGPAASYEAFSAAVRAYPASTIPPAIMARARATYTRFATRDARLAKRGRRFLDAGAKWQLYGPRKHAVTPGVT